jgi:hypothetical protein
VASPLPRSAASEENRRLKTAVADLTLDRTVLQEALPNKW